MKSCVSHDCLTDIPESILYYPVLAGPPAGAGVVTLKDKRRLLSAEFRQKTTGLHGKQKRGQSAASCGATLNDTSLNSLSAAVLHPKHSQDTQPALHRH